MITLSKVKSTFIEKFKLIVKVSQYGTKTAKQAGPFGFDSNPLENYTAIYADTANINESVIIGYINKNFITEPGESRLYSLNELGEVQAFAYATKSGQLWLNGSEYAAVKFEPLKTAINEKDNLINLELEKIRVALASVGGVYAAGSISTNLDNAKSENVKLK